MAISLCQIESNILSNGSSRSSKKTQLEDFTLLEISCPNHGPGKFAYVRVTVLENVHMSKVLDLYLVGIIRLCCISIIATSNACGVLAVSACHGAQLPIRIHPCDSHTIKPYIPCVHSKLHGHGMDTHSADTLQSSG